MRISVVTPSFNQGEFLGRCLASVQSQTHAPIEHLVYDPGSTDDSRSIAASAPGVTLIAEPDLGQGDAVAKGMLKASGDIVAWLNSDDAYADETVFAAVAEAFASEAKPDIVYGRGHYIGRDDEYLRIAYVIPKPEQLQWRLQKEVGILQPATFISRALIDRIGPVSKDLHFCMDYEFWIRAQMAGAKFMYLDKSMAHARYYPDNKTLGQRGESLLEVVGMVKSKFGFVHYDWIKRLADFRLNNNDGILKTAGNQKQDLERLARKTTELNYLINGDFDSASAFLSSKTWDMKLFTVEDLKTQAHRLPGEYATPVAVQDGVTPGCESYNVGPRRWAFRNSWLRPELAESAERIDQLAATRTSDTCVIVGNGPSLNATRLDLLEGQDVFITNYAILSKKLRKLAKYLCVTNYLVAEQGAHALNTLEGIHKILPYWLSYCILPTPETHYVRSVGVEEFGADIRENISWRSSVSFFTMQIAFALGYRKVVLVGFDHSYRQPELLEEGSVIRQKDDDPNHFDHRYFKGKVWQAADPAKMEAVYRLAKDAFEADGREIVNCTEGGKLDIFRRSTLDEELGDAPLSAGPCATIDQPAKLLVIDMTASGNGTATGELKQALLGGMENVRTLQICMWSGGLGRSEDGKGASVSEQEADALIEAFEPDMILYRPTPDTPVLHAFAMQQIVRRSSIPLAVWIMDDWPEQLKLRDPQQAEDLDRDWRKLLDVATIRLSISERMSDVLKQRYGKTFIAVANGVVREDWQRRRLLIRYGGGLAPGMGLGGVRRVGEAVEAVAGEGVDARLEILTRKHWHDAAAAEFADLKRTSFNTSVLSAQAYREWLMGADAVAICYNFDDVSKAYVQHSMANKLPECLASGAVLIAHGPEDIATIARAKELDCAIVVSEPSVDQLVKNMRRIVEEPDWAAGLTARAQQVAFDRFGLERMRERLLASIRFGLRAPVERRDADTDLLDQVSQRLDAIASSLG